MAVETMAVVRYMETSISYSLAAHREFAEATVGILRLGR